MLFSRKPAGRSSLFRTLRPRLPHPRHSGHQILRSGPGRDDFWEGQVIYPALSAPVQHTPLPFQLSPIPDCVLGKYGTAVHWQHASRRSEGVPGFLSCKVFTSHLMCSWSCHLGFLQHLQAQFFTGDVAEGFCASVGPTSLGRGKWETA